MNSILSTLTDAGNLLLVILGFSLIIVLHELGHFVAARWAGIRVLAFAVGFGPALFSFRKGLGWRHGSSEPEYRKSLEAGTGGGPHARSISPTEYRLNVLPFGGYVKMLGQDDIDPTARSNEPDSYQNCKPWKRMIVISAGVTANVITAALLFIAVFMIGLRTEPPKIGYVEPGSPAATTMPANAAALGVTSPGLKPGDRIVGIDGDNPLSFNDLVLASAMARAGTAVNIDIRRSGVEGVLHFPIVPVVMPSTKMLYIGAGPAASDQLSDFPDPKQQKLLVDALNEADIPGLAPGMTMTSVNGKPVASAYDLVSAAQNSGGQPVPAVFTDDSGRTLKAEVPVRPRMMRDRFMVASGQAIEARHLLGIMPVLAVEAISPGEGAAAAAGLQAGDVFARIGATEWPSIPSGIAEVRAARNSTVRVVVVRKNDDGLWLEHDLGDVPVNSSGLIGFQFGDSSALGPWVGTAFAKSDNAWTPPPLAPGTRIVAVNGHATANLLDVREQLRLAVNTESASPSAESHAPVTVDLTTERPLLTADGSRPIDHVAWNLTPEARKQLTSAAWEPTLDPGLFAPDEFELKAAGPLSAIGMGLRETQRVMMTTYVTFARLFQGSIKIEHLKGPVGIAHAGTQLAERGPVWLLFFMALISVNLAVINFLPIPIADGGHFVFLLYEQFTGKPVSAAVQNFAAIAGLVLLATVFLVVTFNDISNLFKG